MKAYPLKSDGVLKRYDYLWRLSADRWAWEYLRRNPVFRFDSACCEPEDVSERMAPCAPIRLLRPRVSQTLAQRWGLLVMPNPEQTGLEAAGGGGELQHLGQDGPVLRDHPSDGPAWAGIPAPEGKWLCRSGTLHGPFPSRYGTGPAETHDLRHGSL